MKKPNARTATIVAAYLTDLQLGLRWAKANKVIKSVGMIREIGFKSGKRYAVKVRVRTSKKDLRNLIKDKFGSFIRVV
jgi:hypothetical protein